jgi:flagellar protein FlgJ
MPTAQWRFLWSSAVVIGVLAVPDAAAAATVTATVHTSGSVLNVRSGPSTNYGVIGRLADGTRLAVVCQWPGEVVAGTVRTTALWDRLTSGGYVSDAFVAWSPARPALRWCATAVVRVGGGTLFERANTSTLLAPVAQLRDGTAIPVVCQLAGQGVAGTQRSTALWDRLSNGRYVTDAYIAWSPARPPLAWCTLTAALAPIDHAAFIYWSVPYAQASQRAYRVPASVTIAQAILESGWGRSGLSTTGNAYFGVKCFGTPGPIAAGCRPYATTECSGTTCFRTTALFRVYTSANASFVDHGRVLATNPRYAPAFVYVNAPEHFAEAIAKAGYATSPTYAASLIHIMRVYDLYRFNLRLP